MKADNELVECGGWLLLSLSVFDGSLCPQADEASTETIKEYAGLFMCGDGVAKEGCMEGGHALVCATLLKLLTMPVRGTVHGNDNNNG